MALIKILIIEENTKAANPIKAAIKHLGYSLIGIVPSADQAIAFITKKKPNIIIVASDAIPIKQAIQIGEEIRSRFNIIVVYIAPDNRSKTILKQAGLREGLDYLTSPIREHQIYFAIETASSRNSLNKPGGKLNHQSPSEEVEYRTLVEK